MLGPVELAALGLAAARGTQLIVWDSILDRPRERLELWHAQRHDKYWPTFVRTLFNCLYCVGFHLSWIAVLAYTLTIDQWPGLVIFGIESFAVAGLQMLLNRRDDTWGGN